MSNARFIIGDSLTETRTLPDASVDLILTSPPFLALRSYLPAGHVDKASEVGSEPDPAAYIDVLLTLTEEWRRILAPHGSLCVELGDTYSGSGGAGGDYGADGLREGQPKFRQGTPRWDGRPEGQVRTTTSDPVTYPSRGLTGWPLAKSLCLIPESYRWALVYGRNPHNGRTTPPWRVRNVVRWVRPNPPVGALGDKFRPATSDMVVACVSGQRYFDLDAVRANDGRAPSVQEPSPKALDHERLGHHGKGMPAAGFYHANGGAPPLDWWQIPTAPYAGAHYAAFPPALCTRPILAMCPPKVCTVCGVPTTRIVGPTEYQSTVAGRVVLNMREGERLAENVNQWKGENGRPGHYVAHSPTLGWTDCGHNAYRNGRVFDPFAGSGTVLSVATGHGRDAIGIDLDGRNADLARQRCGMFLTVDGPTP